jgi:hypothetical protein
MATNSTKQIVAATVFSAALLGATAARAQNRVNWIGLVGVEAARDQGAGGAGEGVNWVSGNPPENFQPDRTFGIGEYGSIANGGTALVDHAISRSPTDIRRAEDTGSTGTLVIRSGGATKVQTASGGAGANNTATFILTVSQSNATKTAVFVSDTGTEGTPLPPTLLTNSDARVPEPATATLLALAGIGICLQRCPTTAARRKIQKAFA